MGLGSKPNIVFVVMDCVRAQNLPIYGYDKPTAPRIFELAGEGLRFDNAITAAEQTLSSTTSLFTGTYPSTHDLRVTGEKLNPGLHTLAEAMERSGYATHCINCSNPYVSPFTDVQRGFDEYACVFPTLRRWLGEVGREGLGAVPDPDPESKVGVTSSNATWRGALADRLRWWMTAFVDGGAARAFGDAQRLLSDTARSQPTFVYVHLMETHGRYLPPIGHRRRFLPDNRGRKVWRVNQVPLLFQTGAAEMEDLDFAIVEGLYNGAIHYSDKLFGRFYDSLRKRGLLDNTIVILTADHGESLGEHGLLGHGQCVYDTVVRVPLLIWGPVVESRMRGSALPDVVQNIDVTASCLQWGGAEDDDPIKAQLEGRPLPLAPSEEPAPRYAISESVRLFERRHAAVLKKLGSYRQGAIGVRTRTHKLIWNVGGQEEFYDLVSDPGEADNLIQSGAAEIDGLRAALQPLLPRFEFSLDATLARLEDGGAAGVDPQVEQRLRELGYMD